MEACIAVPGRVNLIGEHVDYHGLPVLPIAIQRRVSIRYRRRHDRWIRASSAGHGDREFEWTTNLNAGAPGDWHNYLKAAARAVGGRWGILNGIDAEIVSDLPTAAGLSSSSALLTGCVLALLRANGIAAGFEELMDVLPEAEQFVGTRGGGMDHAAVLGSKAGCASLIRFDPISICPVAIPAGWAFVIAHSLTTAEKSGAHRDEFNARRLAGSRALQHLGLSNFREAIEAGADDGLLQDEERRCFLHVTGEARRTLAAVDAIRGADSAAFGRLLSESHASLRDLLQVSNFALDELVAMACDAGALGARVTGAGFGGCAVLFCESSRVERICTALEDRFYRKRAGFDRSRHLIVAEPSPGVLND